MSKTRELQKLIRSDLLRFKDEGVVEVYFRVANRDAMYPHIVFDITGADDSDLSRTDYDVDIDIYAKTQETAYDLADKIEDVFRAFNQPEEGILPTFHLVTRATVDDPDTDIKRELIRMTCQLYVNE